MIPAISAAPTTHIPPIHAAHTAPVIGAAAQAVAQVPAIRKATTPLTPNKPARQPAVVPISLDLFWLERSFKPCKPSFICSLLI